jgi:hypothetical protein
VQEVHAEFSEIDIKSFLTGGLFGTVYDAIVKTDDIITGIAVDYKSTGDNDFSYFNVRVVITASMEVLDDDGKYHPLEFTKTIFLDESGNGRAYDTYTFEKGYRNVKNITWEVTSLEGYVVKK